MTDDRTVESKRRVRFGPGLLVTAAFIGPGTVVTASKAGAQFGSELLWTIAFASFGTIVLQSLAARLGILSGKGLGEVIRESLSDSRWLRPVIALIIAAIGIGNTAYQTGNLMGAAAGASTVAPGGITAWLVIVMLAAVSLIALGRYRVLQSILIAMVLVLSVAFVATAAISRPDTTAVFKGLFTPTVDPTRLTIIIGLIGTTIVPYNLFLHSSGAAETWKGVDRKTAVRQADWDTLISVALGGFVTIAITLTAASAFHAEGLPLDTTGQIALQLRPSLGPAAAGAFALGFFAAGMTSAVTAPIATSFAISGCLGWPVRPSETRFKLIAASVILVGGAIAIGMGKSPASTILFAQLANGLLLPFVAVFLLTVSIKTFKPDRRVAVWIRLLSALFVVTAVVLLGFWRIYIALNE